MKATKKEKKKGMGKPKGLWGRGHREVRDSHWQS